MSAPGPARGEQPGPGAEHSSARAEHRSPKGEHPGPAGEGRPSARVLRIGVIGLGRAFSIMLPTFRDPRVRLVAAADPRPEARARFESDFGVTAFADAAALRTVADRPFQVRLARSGRTLTVGADQSILDVLRAAGLTLASSCESGTCGTCRTGLLAGEADHRDLVLDDDAREHAIMICVSRAKSDEITIDR